MRRWVTRVIRAALLLLLALACLQPQRFLSPGELRSDHQQLPGNCFACHVPWRGATAQRCIVCHAPAMIGRRTPVAGATAAPRPMVPFHQQLIEPDCLACHDEHDGAQPGRRSRRPFAHVLLRPETRARCAACHQPPTDELHRRYGGDCGQCHLPEHWRPATFDHAGLFALEGDHDAPCARCHAAGDYRHYSCYGCHEHRPAAIRARHLEAGISNFDNCVACHRGGDDEDRIDD